MEMRDFAAMAALNTLPEIVDDQYVPAIIDAARAIVNAEKLGEVIAYDEGWKEGKPTHRHLIGISAALRTIGAKLQPGMSGAQASAWVDAIVLSLARYPAKTARLAIERAAGEPFPFGIGSVDAKLHELAAAIEERNRAARLRLENLHRKIERAQRQKALPAPKQEDRPLTIEEIAKTPHEWVELGRKLGHITEEEYQAAMALREKDT